MKVSFKQARHYTPTGGRKIDLVVIHTMEAPEKPTTAETVADWFAGPSAPQASAHYCVDNDSVVQCVRDGDVAWHAPGANHNGLGIEHAGYASQSAKDWSDSYSRAELATSAKLTAQLAKKYSIPVRHLTVAELKAGHRGFIGHIDATNAFSAGAGHTDPGKSFPWAYYLGLVAKELEALGGAPAPKPAPAPAPRPATAFPPTVEYGDRVWPVSKAQKLLNAHGAHLAVDGVFGHGTETAVKAFQGAHHLTADGIVGPNTWKALLA